MFSALYYKKLQSNKKNLISLIWDSVVKNSFNKNKNFANYTFLYKNTMFYKEKLLFILFKGATTRV